MARLSAFMERQNEKTAYTISILIERGFEKLKTEDDGTVVLKCGGSMATISPLGRIIWSTAVEHRAAPDRPTVGG